LNSQDLAPHSQEDKKFDYRLYFKSLGFSMLGILLFLMPIEFNGNQTVLIGVITHFLKANLSGVLLEAVVAVTIISTLGGAYYLLFQPDWKQTRPSLYSICHTNLPWFVMRLIGGIVGLLVYFQWGPEVISGETTGQTVFIDIGIPTLIIMSLAGFLMPFLTDFGFMEFVGTIVRKPFKVLFRLPGRSAIDATASFVGSSTLGVLITVGQYETGMYSRREAVAVATNFSVVSLPFSLVIANTANLDHIFFVWYGTAILACIFCALIMVRIPPLSTIPDSYYKDKKIHEEIEQSDCSLFKWSILQAMERTSKVPSARKLLFKAWNSSLDLVFGIIPPCMAVATIASILVFHTNFFVVLAYPIELFLNLINLPEAEAAAPGFLVGFLDQFMPALVAGGIESEITRFVLAGLSLCQLIFMAQIGIMLLRSSLSMSLWMLFVIFCLRTLITFPIFLVAGLIIFPL